MNDFDIFRRPLRNKGIKMEDIEEFLPKEILCKHYAHYMRLLHRVCGEILLKIHKEDKQEEVRYLEKIPETLGKITSD